MSPQSAERTSLSLLLLSVLTTSKSVSRFHVTFLKLATTISGFGEFIA